MLKIKIACSCGAEMELGREFLKSDSLCCPNCGQKFDEKEMNAIKETLSGYYHMMDLFSKSDDKNYELITY